MHHVSLWPAIPFYHHSIELNNSVFGVGALRGQREAMRWSFEVGEGGWRRRGGRRGREDRRGIDHTIKGGGGGGNGPRALAKYN